MQQQFNIPAITSSMVKQAVMSWRSKGGQGVSIILDPVHVEFTVDLTNLMLHQAYGQLLAQINAANAPKIVLSE